MSSRLCVGACGQYRFGQFTSELTSRNARSLVVVGSHFFTVKKPLKWSLFPFWKPLACIALTKSKDHTASLQKCETRTVRFENSEKIREDERRWLAPLPVSEDVAEPGTLLLEGALQISQSFREVDAHRIKTHRNLSLHWLLLQRSLIWFPASTLWLTTTYNVTRCALLTFGITTHACGIHTWRQNTRIHKNK